ncbi:MAG: DNA-processing protein DprA [Thermomonas sp.]|uniref:DNA-processing protein DprA n=1 Tax=Thermomonas sp. TaxID=1971895 RepID=UPI0039E237F4
MSEQTQAILLLTAWFGKQGDAGPTPLTPTEWGRFALFLLDIGRKPADLLHVSDVDAVLSGFEDKKITPGRVRKLLERSAALGIALEKWQRAGLWVMTRSDADYPRCWKQRLKNDAPPVLFGAGNRDLLNRGGIAVVGSRDLDESQVAFTGRLGREIAFQGLTVISGGARGADEAAMLGALESEGMAIGVLADSLLRACTSSKYRKALIGNDLALVSPFNPEAGFNVGNAMARNRYVYCLSDAAIVVAATESKGGTWAGAVENLKQGWVPLWVRQGAVPGNRALVDKGAYWLPDDFDVQYLVDRSPDSAGWLTASRVAEDVVEYSMQSVVERREDGVVGSQDAAKEATPEGGCQEGDDFPKLTESADAQKTSHQIFLHRLGVLLSKQALTLKELQGETLFKQKELSAWLKQAEADGVVIKTRSPVKYRLRTADDVDGRAKEKKVRKKTSLEAGTGKQTGFEF